MESPTTHHAARVLNAAYLVRLHCRPGQERARTRALARMAEATRAGLAAAPEPGAILYAVAVGLYERGDARFN